MKSWGISFVYLYPCELKGAYSLEYHIMQVSKRTPDQFYLRVSCERQSELWVEVGHTMKRSYYKRCVTSRPFNEG